MKNNSALSIFNFENTQVRCVGTSENPLWIAKDVCAVLGIKKPENAYTRLSTDERVDVTTGDGITYVTVNESGLYNLIFRSRKEVAERFRKWVTSEVLPSIRKTGSYNSPQPEQMSLQDAIAIAEIVADSLSFMPEPVKACLKLETLGGLRPDIKPTLQKTIKAIAAANPQPDITHTPTEIGVMVAEKLEIKKVSAIAINKKLTELGYQESIKRINSKGKEVHHYYQPTDKGREFGQIELSAFKAGEASSTKPNTRWYGAVVGVIVENWQVGSK